MKKVVFVLLVIFISCSPSTRRLNIYWWKDTEGWELARAVGDGDTCRINRILQDNKISVDYREPNSGESLLAWAVVTNNEKMVRFLLSKGANPNLHNWNDGGSPIVVASELSSCSINILKLLLDAGGNPNDHVLETDSIRNPIFLQLPYLDVDSNKIVLSRIVRTPLNSTNDLSKIKLLLDYGADIDFATIPGETALNQACQLDVIKYLLVDCHADYRNSYTVTVDSDTIYFVDSLSKRPMRECREDSIIIRQIYHYLQSKGEKMPNW